MKRLLSLLLLLFAGGLASAQNIVQIEYYFDTDAGIGSNKITSVTAAADGTFTFNPDVSAISKGYHFLYIRVKDSKNGWSQTTRRSIEVQPAPIKATTLAGEYSIDTDNGIGSNKAFSITPNTQDAGTFNLSVTGFVAGYHTAYIRFKDAYGVWGQTIRRVIQVLPANNKLVLGEYFVDKDPGFGSGTAIQLSSQTTDIAQQFAAQASSLTAGYHKLYVRFKDAAGFWSQTSRQNIEVIKQPGVIKIIAAEFFFKKDPGIGNGTKLTVPVRTSDTLSLAIPANIKTADIDTLYIRVRDNRDSSRWSYRAMKRIVKAAQTITFAATATKKFGIADFDPGAKTTSNMPLAYTSSDTTVATIVAGKVHLKKTGTTVLSAAQAGNISFKIATTVKQTLTVAKGDQTIAFGPISIKTYNDADFVVTATTASGLPVTYSSADTTIATIVNGKIHIKTAGKCNIKASQAGNTNYNAAKDSVQVLTINKAGQQIGFPALPSLAVGATDYSPTAIATSKLPLTYTSSNTAVATIVGGRIHAVALGSATITATQPGNVNYTAAVAQAKPVTVIKGNQSISFSQIQSLPYGTVDFTPKAVSNSGLPLTFGSANTAVATIINGKIHITGIGTTRITASQAGNSSYNAARDTTQLFTVYKMSQIVTFAQLPAIQIGTPDITPVATSSAGLSVTFTSSNTAVATIVNGKIHAVAPGTTIIYAVQAGTDYINSGSAKQPLTITKGSQTITFAALSAKTYGIADFSAGATASSGLAVSYTSSNAAVATIVNGLIHITGVGTTNITATQAGNTSYNAATSVVKALSVTKGSQLITFAEIPVMVPGTPDFSAGAAASSALAISYTSSNTAVATIVNGLIHITGIGTTNITAAQAGNTVYNVAASVVKTLTVSKAGQQITFAAITTTPYGTADFSPGASASSGLGVTYSSSNTAVATIVNGLLHITGVGSSVITASQPGNVAYNAAANVNQTLNISKAKQTITFAVFTSKEYNAPNFSAGATANSGLQISYTSSNTAVATIVNGLIHVTGSGTSTIQASQTGNAFYEAATSVGRILTVKAKPAGASVSTFALAADNNDISVPETQVAVKQAVSPNGDGVNDVLVIDGITAYTENTVTLINPNGLKIYERSGYDNQQVVFDGHSSVTGAMQKPGTYYYVISYKTQSGWKNQNGYFVLKY